MSIQSLTSAVVKSSTSDLEPLTAVLHRLGWQPREVVDRKGAVHLSVSVGGIPQILFARLQAEAKLSTAVSLGYSHEAPLAVDWREDRFVVHPTLTWTNTPGDKPLASLDPANVDEVSALLHSLGRDTYRRINIAPTKGALPDRLAAQFADFRRSLRELDEWLVRPETDPFLLFHQLLFVRIFEDRNPDVAPERMIDLYPESTMDRAERLLSWYGQNFNSDLFGSPIELAAFPEAPVKELFQALVLPWNQLELDFSVSEDDLAGRLYESYLENAVVLEDKEIQLFAWAKFEDLKKKTGAFYTPGPVADYLAKETILPWLDSQKPLSPADVKIIDPACGSGAFLSAAYKLLIDYFESRHARPLTAMERSELLEGSIFGVDIDREALMLARLRLLEIADLPAGRLPQMGANLVHGDALAGSIGARAFDIVLANPPFAGPKLATKLLSTESLRSRFPAASGTGSNLAYAFADLALELLRPTGAMGLVLPRVALDGEAGSALRSAIGAERLTSITDFGANLVFDGASAYVALICADHRPDSKKSVRLRKLEDRGTTREETLEALTEPQQGRGFQRSTRRSALAKEASWTPFWARWCGEIRPTLRHRDFGAIDSDQLPKLVIGTQLGAQDSFTFNRSETSVKNDVVQIAGHSIPASLVSTSVRGRNVRPFQLIGETRLVVIPKMGEDPAIDDLVESRGGVPRSARHGNLDLLRAPKVLIRSLSGEPSALADFTGDLMPAQGGAGVACLVPSGLEHNEVAAVEALINCAFYQWFLQGLGHPKSSAVQLMRHHYALLPWPFLTAPEVASLADAGRLIREIGGSERGDAARHWAARAALDETAYEILGIPLEVRSIVGRELWREL